MKYLWLWFAFSFWGAVLMGQTPLSTDYLGIEAGMSNNSVTSMLRDANGYMWLGTYDGLNRYDGYDFKIFRHQRNDTSSISNNRINCITQDKRRRLWVGTHNGLNIFDPVHQEFHRVYYVPTGQSTAQLLTGRIAAICTGADGTVFIASENRGLLYCAPGQRIARQIPLAEAADADYTANALGFSSTGVLLVTVASRGLYQYQRNPGLLRQISRLPQNGLCLEAKGPDIWIGADDGLYKYSRAQQTCSPVFQSSNKVVGLSLLQNQLWIASDGDGVLILDIRTGKLQSYLKAGDLPDFTSSAVYTIYHDSEQRTWIGSLRGGINIVDPGKNGFESLVHDPLNPNSLIQNFTLSCAEDRQHHIWIGTDGGGLSKYNPFTGNYTNYVFGSGAHDLSSNFITTLLNDDQDQLWIGTWGSGINRFNKKTGQFAHYRCWNASRGIEDKNVWELFQDSRKNIWAGICEGSAFYKYNKSSDRFEVFDPSLGNIIALYEDSDGQLWGGDYTSLIKIDPVHRRHIRYNIGFSVRDIYEDANHNFWIATEGNGLLSFNRQTGRYLTYTEDDGLSNNAVMQILPDDQGRLWLSTIKGISVLDTRSRKIRTILQSDGILSNQLSYHGALRLSSGQFLFGGIRGMNRFDPDKVLRPARRPAALLTNIAINNQPLEDNSQYISAKNDQLIQGIRLPFNKAGISLTFVTPEYGTPDKIKYAYYLEGWDKDWNYSGNNRIANYTRLREGHYTFKVRVADAYNNWDAGQTLLTIDVLPPWFRSWWAYLLYTLIGAALIYLLMRYRSRQIELKYEVAFAKRQTEQEKELNEKKLDFFTSISHEIRSPLSLIINPIKELIPRFDQEPESAQLNIVYRNAKRLLSLADQLLLFRKADTQKEQLKWQPLNLHQLSRDVYECFTQQAKTNQIDYRFISNNPDLKIYGDYEKLEIVLFNLLSNAIKFTDAHGSVCLELEERNMQVLVSVSDTGPGIPDSEEARLFKMFYQVGQKSSTGGFGIGLYLAKKFTEAHEGTLTYQSPPGKGTRFTLTLRKEPDQDFVITAKTKSQSPLLKELAEDPFNETPEETVLSRQPSTDIIVSGRKTILIADDDREVRHYLQKILMDEYAVVEAEDGEKAFELLLKNAPDLVISDFIMKEMNGIDLCKKIKQHPELGHIPVILLTASAEEDTKLQSIEGGADDYIIKPFDKTLLMARIENIFKSRNALQQYFLETITLQKNSTRVESTHKDFINRCIEVVEKHLDQEDFSIKMLSREIGMSHSGLYKRIKQVSGLSANAFIRFIRLRKAALMLLTTNTNINEAAYAVGIHDIKYFREQFKKLYGMTPTQYIRKYKHSFNKESSIIMKM